MRQNVKMIRCAILLGISAFSAVGHAGAEPDGQKGCHVMQHGKQVELCSPSFVYRLDTAAGLRAQSWENRLAGKTVSLGNGAELEMDIGLPDRPLTIPLLEVSSVQVVSEGEAGEVAFMLTAKEPAISASVTYRWDAKQPVLRKFVDITNKSNRELNRLLNVRLGVYRTNAKVTEYENRGFPAYLNDEFFLSLAHPAGWARARDAVWKPLQIEPLQVVPVVDNGQVGLRQYPGIKVAPGKHFQCMEAVYGVAKTGEAKKAFVAHVRSRMRRVVREHDKPYAIFDNFGSWPFRGVYENTEADMLHGLSRLAESQKATGCRFDLCSIDFWVDNAGDLKRFNPQHFPNDITKLKPILDQLGTAPGLWIDSGWIPGWTINLNPAVKNCFSEKGGTGILCRATEPLNSMYIEAFRYHVRHNGVRLLKLDNLGTSCSNPHHEHLPGLYSAEPIENAQIELLRALDAECPDIFLMLYWGHLSPWWLLYGDTIFDAGLCIEAATPCSEPAPYIRDSVTRKLDQAQWIANQSTPPLGKDSLGIWLSNWQWNSWIGKERWEEGFVMDMCRGSMLAQVWAGHDWLSPPEWKHLSDFVALLRAQPGCFGNPRFILGNPFNQEAYGYCCTDGRRAFLALNNCTWKDNLLPLALYSAWGLPDGQTWDLYRWYPDPAKMQGQRAAFGEKVSIALRPFEVVLLEVVPHGRVPSLNRNFEPKPLPAAFVEPSRPINISLTKVPPSVELESTAPWTVLEPAEIKSAGGATLSRQKDGSILASGNNPPSDTYTITAHTDLTGITAIRLETLTDPNLPCSGPGRASNGNFALDEFSVRAWPQGNPAAAVTVALHDPVADFSQTAIGNWPVAAAIDGNPASGWSIHPLEGVPHAAIFHTREPIGFGGGAVLEFAMKQGSPSEHNLGRVRFSVATAKPPIVPPKPAEPRTLIKGQIPASRKGGIIVVTTDKFLIGKGKPAGRTVAWQPVLGSRFQAWGGIWQAWRLAVEPSADPRPFELEVTTNDTGLKCNSYFLPR